VDTSQDYGEYIPDENICTTSTSRDRNRSRTHVPPSSRAATPSTAAATPSTAAATPSTAAAAAGDSPIVGADNLVNGEAARKGDVDQLLGQSCLSTPSSRSYTRPVPKERVNGGHLNSHHNGTLEPADDVITPAGASQVT